MPRLVERTFIKGPVRMVLVNEEMVEPKDNAQRKQFEILSI